MATGTGTPTISTPILAGVGLSVPGFSRILPAASGSISHARIIRGERSPESANYFHEIFRELGV